MATSANHKGINGNQAIKYVGRYKPNRTYSIGNGLIIMPAGSDMIEYGFGSTTIKIRHNISYLTSENGTPNPGLKEKYREWLVFDAFILNDDFPIRAFDAQKIGHIETVPSSFAVEPPNADYWQPDYNNISGAIFSYAHNSPELPTISYSETYQRYLCLPTATKEMIEWFVSFPTYLSQAYCRSNPFFNLNYWQIFHTTILIESLIGLPDSCPQSPKKCACGNPLHPHHAMSRSKFLKEFISLRINNHEIAEDYANTVETGYAVRNPFAHSPQFDRSTHKAPLEQPEIYDINRVATDFKHDSAALMLLAISIRDVARFLLLNDAFGIRFFPPLRKLTSFPVK